MKKGRKRNIIVTNMETTKIALLKGKKLEKRLGRSIISKKNYLKIHQNPKL